MAKYNKSDIPLHSIDQISNKFTWNNFPFKEHFRFVGILEAKEIREKGTNKISFIECSDIDLLKKPCVYALIIEDKLFKVGQTGDSLKGRIQSYNTGQQKYRSRGTNSVTNYWALQSLTKIGKKIKVYAYFIHSKKYEIFGEEGTEVFPSSKTVERHVLAKLKKDFGELPIGCTQK